MKRSITVGILAFIFIIQYTGASMAQTDSGILSDPVNNVYSGNLTSEAISSNINFSDVASDYWAKEPITRLGALSVVKGYNEGNTKSFRPSATVTKEEAIALLLRVIGQEEAAVVAAQNIASNPEDPTLTVWSRGYLQIAANLGLITAAELNDALLLEQDQLDPEINFIRKDPVSREQIARWIVEALDANVPGSLVPINNHQLIFNLSDWEAADTENLSYIEAVMQANIMVGDGTRFKPKANLTRSELAQIVVNMEDLLYSTMGLSAHSGIVGSIQESADLAGVGVSQSIDYRIRNESGLIDQVSFEAREDSQGRTTTIDVPVLRDGRVQGLGSLKEGDFIQYLVHDASKEMRYVYKTDGFSSVALKGKLQPVTQIADGQIAIKNNSGMVFNYQMIDHIYDVAAGTVQISGTDYPISALPVENTVTLTLQNDLVTYIEYKGGPILSMEVSGIVKEVNVPFSFITIESWNGGEITKYFNPSTVDVEKLNFYDTEDEVGYIDEVYPMFGYDEKDSFIEAIEVGDIVHLKLDPSNLKNTTAISAKTNYSVRFGEIVNVAEKGSEGVTLRVIYEDQSVDYLDVNGMVPVMLRQYNVGTSGLKTGQLVKVLMNQAVLAPGRTVAYVKQIDIDPYGNLAESLYKGNLGLYNPINQTISLMNSYRLSPGGWMDYSNNQKFDLTNNDLEIYYKGERVGLSYVDLYLRSESMKVFAVTEDDKGIEKLAKLVFDEGRGDVMAATTIAYANGFDAIRLVSASKNIGVDDGTIVVKDGHIVSTSSILSPDYAQVVMGDRSQAVIVNILTEPKNDALAIFRGRIDSITDGQQFNVASNARLNDMEWVYSPIEREFILSYDTTIVDEEGRQPLSSFIDYTELTKVDEVYTIIAEGAKATHLYKSPYVTEGVIGEIYETSDTTLSIRDTVVYDSETKLWETLSLTNNYGEITIDATTVIIKNNQVISVDDIDYGDQIRALTTENLSDEVTLNNNRTVTGYIIFVE